MLGTTDQLNSAFLPESCDPCENKTVQITFIWQISSFDSFRHRSVISLTVSKLLSSSTLFFNHFKAFCYVSRLYNKPQQQQQKNIENLRLKTDYVWEKTKPWVLWLTALCKFQSQHFVALSERISHCATVRSVIQLGLCYKNSAWIVT